MLITWFVGKSWISQPSIFKVDRFYLCSIITGRNEVVAKVMFLLVSVILYTGGGYPSMHSPGGVLSQHALQVVSQHAFEQVSRGMSGGGCLVQGAALGGCLVWGGACFWGVPAPGGCLLPGNVWPSVMVFWFGGLLVWLPSGLVAFWLKVSFWFGGLLVWLPSDWRWPSGWKWSSVMAFWCDLLLWPSGKAFWYGGLS